MFILQDKFTMNKSKLNLGANVGDIPRGINRRMYDPARVWRLTGDPLGPGSLRFIGNPAGGCEERQDLVAQQAVHEGRFILWWAGLRGKA